jgi:hypothetical protein
VNLDHEVCRDVLGMPGKWVCNLWLTWRRHFSACINGRQANLRIFSYASLTLELFSLIVITATDAAIFSESAPHAQSVAGVVKEDERIEQIGDFFFIDQRLQSLFMD